MKREKIHLEYMLKATSKNLIWVSISTPSGLETWFANKVVEKEKSFTFTWGKTDHREAEVIVVRAFSHIRFHWMDDDNDKEYFELKMTNNELTGDFVLEIIDFSDADEADDLRDLWNSQVEVLKRTCGF